MFMLDDKENVTEERKMQIVWGQSGWTWVYGYFNIYIREWKYDL